MTYAAGTAVAADRTRAEIERTLERYGADQFAYGWDGTRAMVGFRMHDRQVRFVVPMPDPTERRLTHTPTGQARSASAITKEIDQAVRSRWRALLLIIKAKLEAVEAGVTIFEDEFGMHVILPDGTTVRDWVQPAIDEAYTTGRVPSLLGLPSGRPM